MPDPQTGLHILAISHPDKDHTYPNKAVIKHISCHDNLQQAKDAALQYFNTSGSPLVQEMKGYDSFDALFHAVRISNKFDITIKKAQPLSFENLIQEIRLSEYLNIELTNTSNN